MTRELRPGRASKIVDLGNGTILRTGGDPQREAAIMDLVRTRGFLVPRVHEVRADALVLERIEGPTMAGDLARRPWLLARHVRTLVGLHHALHAIPYDGGAVVHFDFHPENVLLSPSGPVVIDWTNARSGEPDADTALTWLILVTSAGIPGRILGRRFRHEVGLDALLRGLPAARAFRLADPHVSAAEKERAERASP